MGGQAIAGNGFYNSLYASVLGKKQSLDSYLLDYFSRKKHRARNDEYKLFIVTSYTKHKLVFGKIYHSPQMLSGVKNNLIIHSSFIWHTDKIVCDTIENIIIRKPICICTVIYYFPFSIHTFSLSDSFKILFCGYAAPRCCLNPSPYSVLISFPLNAENSLIAFIYSSIPLWDINQLL